jgi:hypothetical protein
MPAKGLLQCLPKAFCHPCQWPAATLQLLYMHDVQSSQFLCASVIFGYWLLDFGGQLLSALGEPAAQPAARGHLAVCNEAKAPELNALRKESFHHEGLISLTGVRMINEIIQQVLHLPCSELQVLHGPILRTRRMHSSIIASAVPVPKMICYIVCTGSKLPA